MIKIFNKIELKAKRKGSATVEAALIFPLIMLVVFGIIYLTIIHYQNNVMIAESIRAMNRAGAYWQYIDMDKKGKISDYNENNTPTAFDSTIPKDGIINIEMIKKRNAYRTVIDLASEVLSRILDEPIGKKKNNAKKYVETRMGNAQFKKYTTDEDTIISEEGVLGDGGFMFFGEDLSINISKSYQNPLSAFSKALLGENNVIENLGQKEIIVSSVISNQAEFIRNFDTIYDLASDTYHYITEK